MSLQITRLCYVATDFSTAEAIIYNLVDPNQPKMEKKSIPPPRFIFMHPQAVNVGALVEIIY